MKAIEYFFALLTAYIKTKYALKADFEEQKAALRMTNNEKLIHELAKYECYFTYKNMGEGTIQTGFPFGEHELNQAHGIIVSENSVFKMLPETKLALIIDMAVSDIKKTKK